MPALRPLLLCCLPALLLAAGPAPAATPPAAVPLAAGDERERCAAATRGAERRLGLPRGLLQAIALTESGRWDGADRRSLAWPWTVTSGGDGTYLDSKAAAVAYVDALRRGGQDSIDVGCMQVNLHHHPDAFADLEQALDPISNVAYGAGFLASLQQQTQSWDRAIELYHSSDPDRGRAYRQRVLENWRRLGDEAPAEAFAALPQPSRPPASMAPAAPLAAEPLPSPAGRGVWRWLTPAASFPIAAASAPRPLVFAGPAGRGTGSLLPGLASVPRPASRPAG